MNKLTSELFDNSYTIFVPEKYAPVYKKYIEEKELIKEGVNILQQDGDSDICAIVIPIHKEYKRIEKDLYDIQKGEGGFWGQLGMGYEGETWEVFS
jgi:hypothetical protein